MLVIEVRGVRTLNHACGQGRLLSTVTASWQESDWHYRDPAAGSDASPKHTGWAAWAAFLDRETSHSNFVIGDAGDIVCSECDGLATDLEVGLLERRARELC